MQVQQPQSCKNGRAAIPVCLLGENPLARNHLATLLLKARSFDLLGTELRNGGSVRKKSVVLILSLYSDAGHASVLQRSIDSLQREFPGAKILLVGSHFPVKNLVCFLRRGVRGFVDGAKVDKLLVPAIRAIWAGQIWFSVDDLVLEQLCPQEGNRGAAEDKTLTPQQARVLDFVLRGLANKQVAAELAISETTVKFHLQKIFSKLGTHDRHSLADAVSRLAKHMS